MVRKYDRLKSTVRGALAPYAHKLHLTGPYRCNLDGFTGNELHGWVVRNGSLAGGITVGLFVAEGLLATQAATLFRADVKEAGIGNGLCGFAFSIGKSVFEAAERNGGLVYVRVLDAQQHEIGRYTLPSNAAGGLFLKNPHVDQCRKLLFGDIELLRQLLDKNPTEPDPPPPPPALVPQQKFFSTAPSHPDDLGYAMASGHASLPTYLEYTKLRMRKERDYDTDGNPDDRDHFLNWYLAVYSKARGGLRVPLTADLVKYLNAPMVMGGQKYTLSRMMWWRLVHNTELLKTIDLDNQTWFNKAVYWWAWQEAPGLHLEDCLVPRRHIDALCAVHVTRKDDAFPLSTFMDHFHSSNGQYHFLDVKLAEDRQLFMLCLVMLGLRRPDVLRYLPARSLKRLFERPEGRPSIFESFYQSLLLAPVTESISYERFAAALRIQGYELYSQSFLSFTEAGDRLEAASLPAITTSAGAGAEKVEVQLIGPFEKASGLGQATRLSASILEHTGLVVNSVNFGLDNPAPEGFSKVGKLADYKPAKINLIHLNAESIPLVFAYEPDAFSGAYNIGYFYWELNAPALCHYLGMSLLDEVWVSTEYGVSIYQPEMGDKPVINVGMCYEALPAINKAQARAGINQRFRFTGEEFLYLVAFDSYSFVQRKNPIGVLEAFQRAFPPDAVGGPAVRMIIKTQNRDNVSDLAQEKIWNRVESLIAHDPRILVMNETLSYEALLQLKAGSDCYVSLHRSEGWGFGMIEAMNLEVPVVCTGYSGNLDFCSDATAWMVKAHEVPLEQDDYIFVRRGAKWAEPDLADAAAQLRAVWADPAARAERTAAALKNVRDNFSAAAIATRYGTRLKTILQELALNNRAPGDPL